MAYTLLRPNNPEVQNYLFSGETIVLTPTIDPQHIENMINFLPETIITNGIFALGSSPEDSPVKGHGFPGIPNNKYNVNILGIYIPPEFADQLDRKETTIKQALELGIQPTENYTNAAQHVISGYENAIHK